MNFLNNYIDSFDVMEKVLKELHSHAVDYSIWNSTSIQRFRQYRKEVEDIFKKLKTELDVSHMDDFLKFVAKMRAFIGDFLFYERSASEDAITEYKAALASDPVCPAALNGIVVAYLQGENRRPQKALPYAKTLAQLDPKNKIDVSYIESLITELEKNRQ